MPKVVSTSSNAAQRAIDVSLSCLHTGYLPNVDKYDANIGSILGK